MNYFEVWEIFLSISVVIWIKWFKIFTSHSKFPFYQENWQSFLIRFCSLLNLIALSVAIWARSKFCSFRNFGFPNASFLTLVIGQILVLEVTFDVLLVGKKNFTNLWLKVIGKLLRIVPLRLLQFFGYSFVLLYDSSLQVHSI